MNTELIQKLDELIKIFEDSKELKRITELKEDIYNDKELKSLFDKYKDIKDNYNNDTINIKREIIENEKVSEYRKLENELYFLVAEVNKRLSVLVDRKSCNNESN